MIKMLGLTEYGKPQIITCGLIALLLCAISFAAGISWFAVLPLLLFGWVLYFFRDPERIPPENPLAVLSPADGVITHIEERDEPDFIQGRALMIGIFLSVFDVHLNRAPFPGTVRFIKYKEGSFLDARAADSSTRNEANSIGIATAHPEAKKMLVKQIAGLIARRIVCACEEGAELAAGECVGMIKFGSRTELYLPAEAAFAVQAKVGDKVYAGTTVLGELK
ncbi:MAG: phosphatidylserine decarboxylase family protein [Planctomycetes bacterium]|nr:phosphatidylserine decarboxylase family protein [Planctomycetota bacterium]